MRASSAYARERTSGAGVEALSSLAGPAFSVFGLVAMMGGFDYLFARGYSMEAAAGGSRGVQLLTGAVFLTAALRLALRPADAFAFLRASPLLVAFVLLAPLSTLWADEPGITLRRSAALLGTSWFGLYLAVYYRPEALMRLLAVAFGVFVAIQVLGTALQPGHAFGTQGLRGLLGQKNDFGRLMVLAALTLFLARSTGSAGGLLAWGGFLTASLLALASQSRTAWVLYAGVFALGLPFARLLAGGALAGGARLVLACGAGLAVVFLGASFYASGLDALGKDATLTDRTVIWDLLIAYGLEHPWLGVGYGSFWEGPYGALFAERWRELGHAHNGYLDLWLALGYVGAGLFTLCVAAFALRCVRALIRHGDSVGAYAALALVLMAVGNAVARVIPTHNSIDWVLFVTLFLVLSAATRPIPPAPLSAHPDRRR